MRWPTSYLFFIVVLADLAFAAPPQVVTSSYELQQVEIGSYTIEYAQIGICD
jgi:hypothetical protein